MIEPETLPIDGPHKADHPFKAFRLWPGGDVCEHPCCYFTPEAHREEEDQSDG